MTLAVLLGGAAACDERASPVARGGSAAIARGDAGASAAVASGDAARLDAAPPSTAVEPCTRMRRDGDDFFTAWPHPRARRLETVVRRFYHEHVAVTAEEHRHERKLKFGPGVVAPTALVGPCVDDWRAADPGGILAGSTGRILAGRRYVVAVLDLDDDGSDDVYTFFVDVDTFEVVAAFHDIVNTP